MTIVYGFDVGISGFAAVIRHDNRFVWAKSYVLPADFASTKGAAARRRMARTRQAHRAREWWWNKQASSLGIEVLKTMQDMGNNNFRTVTVDPRMLREFPHRGEETIYTSCLLRCAIVLGQTESLEPWQIYKAIHSAIQKRGYDPDVIWKVKSDRKQQDDAESDKEELARVSIFDAELEKLGFGEAQRLPCFFEAYQMGLWHPEKGITGVRQNGQARPGGLAIDDGAGYGFTAPRNMVERELRLLLTAVRSRYPNLDVDFVLYGPGKVPYASHPRQRPHSCDKQLKPGKATDWHGLLGQKVPRFDNRIIAKCLLMPRFGVCRASDPLVAAFTILMALYNVRVRVRSTGEGRRLTHSEFTALAEAFEAKGKATAKQLEKELVKLGLGFEGTAYELGAARTSGRSAFCRPALRILIDFLRSGQSLEQFYQSVLSRERSVGHGVTIAANTEPLRGLTKDDLRWLERLGEKGLVWQEFSLPQERLNRCYEAESPDEAMRLAMANLNNPVVRHRLYLFRDTLRSMNAFVRDALGQDSGPDRVALEFVREDFMGPKAKRELEKFQKSQREKRLQAKERVAELGLSGRAAALKAVLWDRQSGQDPYDPGHPIGATEIGSCEIDHIVPVSNGGPDAQYNMVLTRRDLNGTKGDRTPWQWLNHDPQRWSLHLGHIEQMRGLSTKTRLLLVREDADRLCERYQGLAETAWIARLASTVARCELDWSPYDPRLEVISGGLTARVRGENRLNDLIGGTQSDSKDKKPRKKDRSDIRHHLLDAMVISFCRQWSRDPEKQRYFKLPEEVTQETFASVLRTSRPIEVPEVPMLEEQFYGLKEMQGVQVMTRREAIVDLAYRSAIPRPILDLSRLENLRDCPHEFGLPDELGMLVSQAARAALDAADTPEDVWRRAVGKIRLRNGTWARRVRVPKGKELPDEAKILPKTPLHGVQIVKPKGAHLGFVIGRPPSNGKKPATWKAQPIYCWQNPVGLLADLRQKGWEVKFTLRTKDYVQLVHDCDNLKAGLYKIVTIKNGIGVFLQNDSTPLNGIQKSINILLEEAKMEPLPSDSGSLL